MGRKEGGPYLEDPSWVTGVRLGGSGGRHVLRSSWTRASQSCRSQRTSRGPTKCVFETRMATSFGSVRSPNEHRSSRIARGHDTPISHRRLCQWPDSLAHCGGGEQQQQRGRVGQGSLGRYPTAHLSSNTHDGAEPLDAAIRDTLVAARVDLVFLAGYMKRVGPLVLAAFKGRILNTHPALLPKFGGKGMYGDHVFEAVLESGETESGVSVHLVDGDYDHGPVVTQCRVAVHAHDSP